MEHRCTAAATAMAETASGFPRTTEVGAAIPRVVCKTILYFSGALLELPPVGPSVVLFLFFPSTTSQALMVPPLIDGSASKLIVGQVQILH
jgi:hypothetical protein